MGTKITFRNNCINIQKDEWKALRNDCEVLNGLKQQNAIKSLYTKWFAKREIQVQGHHTKYKSYSK